MAKILVTGGLGFIGHNLVARLESQGHSVVVTDTQTNYGIVPQDQLDQLIIERCKKIQTKEVYRIDVADDGGIDFLHRKFNFDTVIHTASFPRQKVVNANPQLGSRVMSEGLLNLLENSKKHAVNRFVYLSSSMVYGDFEFDANEDAHCQPQGQYSIMKLAGEALVRDYTRITGMAHTIVRPSAVYGPLDVEDRVVSQFLTTAFKGGQLEVNGRDDYLDFTHIDDATQGIVLAATRDCAKNQTYNITRGQARSLLEAAELAVRIAGQGTVQINPRDNAFPQRGQLNITRARNDFDYRPSIDIEQGFQEYYNWITQIKHD